MRSLAKRVIAFVAKELGVRADRISPQTTIFGDLNTDGDDGDELLEAFGREFSVDMSQCDPSRHFGPEGSGPQALATWIVHASRSGSPEQRAGLKPITISNLIRSAESGRWVDDDDSQ